MSVWSKEHNPETSIKRNTFPQSFLNNLTFNIGGIYPFFCIETLSGDTFEIDCAHALRFPPTYFPLQNRIRVDAHFFYVRSRNLYDEFKEFTTGGTVEKDMPFLSGLTPDFFKTGSLADYFNIPTVVNFSKGDVVSTAVAHTPTQRLAPVSDYVLVSPSGSVYSSTSLPVVGSVPNFVLTPDISFSPFLTNPVSFGDFSISGLVSFQHMSSFPVGVANVGIKSSFDFLSATSTDESAFLYACPVYIFSVSWKGQTLRVPVPANSWTTVKGLSADSYDFGSEFEYLPVGTDVASYIYDNLVSFDVSKEEFESEMKLVSLSIGVVLFPSKFNVIKLFSISSSAGDTFDSLGSYSLDLSDVQASMNPFINGSVPLNACPFRAYEQIYNSFFRDERNNPLLIDGKPYYDKYLPTTSGGADTTKYVLHKRNWEQDFLTTALPSPQQGQAPLVGISSTGVMSISDSEGNVYHAQAITADDADTIVGAKFIKTNQDGTSIPSEVARSLVSYATSGISINDFRNVNALQRYLETNLRRGLKYRDLISARWGVNIAYSEMNMPEFIGGFTDYVNSAQINQQSQGTFSDPLGSYSGQLFAQGKQKHKIRHFCDEPGFIIGVISVVPVPVYSQLLPKMFTKFDQLDFFNPEFGHIGMQPIPMKEVAPLQVAINGGNQNETFGYQRAWYDYLGRVDEVHGQFRSSLRDFVMYRTFSGIPRLSEDFLLVDNNPLDNVFSIQRDVDGNSIDKIFGQIYVDVVSRRPIPRFGIPKLE